MKCYFALKFKTFMYYFFHCKKKLRIHPVNLSCPIFSITDNLIIHPVIVLSHIYIRNENTPSNPVATTYMINVCLGIRTTVALAIIMHGTKMNLFHQLGVFPL